MASSPSIGVGAAIRPKPRCCVRARTQLHAYFDGERLDIRPCRSPPSARLTGCASGKPCCAIPPGATRTYADIARVAGGSARSVGGANGANPIPIVIPCHRVVASDGIGGYSGGDGLVTKHFLLGLEARALKLLAQNRPGPAKAQFPPNNQMDLHMTKAIRIHATAAQR